MNVGLYLSLYASILDQCWPSLMPFTGPLVYRIWYGVTDSLSMIMSSSFTLLSSDRCLRSFFNLTWVCSAKFKSCHADEAQELWTSPRGPPYDCLPCVDVACIREAVTLYQLSQWQLDWAWVFCQVITSLFCVGLYSVLLRLRVQHAGLIVIFAIRFFCKCGHFGNWCSKNSLLQWVTGGKDGDNSSYPSHRS